MSVIHRPAWFFLIAFFAFLLGGMGALFLAHRPPVPGSRLPRTPAALDKETAQLVEQALTEAPWVSPGLKGPPLYMLSFRSCPDCINFKKREFPALHDKGVDTRVIVYARRRRSSPGERAMAAHLACTRQWSLYEDWMSMPPAAYYKRPDLPPPAEGNTKREACLEQGRLARDRLVTAMKKAGWDMEVPALFWKSSGQWWVYLGDNEKASALLRQDFSS